MKIDRKKLAKLTNEEKITLIEALKEKKKRQAAMRTSFKPHDGQLTIINDLHPKRLLICGNGFGKTALRKILAVHLSRHLKKHSVRVITLLPFSVVLSQPGLTDRRT